MARTAFSEKLAEIIKNHTPREGGGLRSDSRDGLRALGARQVVRVLVSLSGKEGLPWHRVINSKGGISLGGEGFREQKELLEAEGIWVDKNGRVNLKVYQWREDD